MAHNMSQKALKKLIADLERDDPLHKKAVKRKADDPQFIDSEWRRLMQFQKGAK
jgi:hypothetical protein